MLQTNPNVNEYAGEFYRNSAGESLTTLLFLQIDKTILIMDKTRLKTIHSKLKLILQELESEIYSDTSSYLDYTDNVYVEQEDDGYAD